jgi:ABC-2 type transport system permease protein
VIDEIRTVLWKEWKQLPVSSTSGFRKSLLSVAFPLVMFGVFFPLTTTGSGFFLIFYFVMLPSLFVANVVADSFAGERERNTLETLLATPMHESSILVGKVAAVIAYGWLLAGATFLLSVIVSALRTPKVPERLARICENPPPAGTDRLPSICPTGYSWEQLAAGLLVILAVASLYASLGILLSLRAPTVRQVQQRLGFIMAAPFLLISLSFLVIRSGSQSWILFFTGADAQALATLGLTLIVVAFVLLMIALQRFQRPLLMSRNR